MIPMLPVLLLIAAVEVFIALLGDSR